jgi:hypothetical protein
MKELLDAIRAAVAETATAEQKTAGAQACRTIGTALEAEIGKPIALAGAPTPSPLTGISPDQAMDLLIARLRAVADDRDKASATAERPASPRPPAPSGLRIAFVQPAPRTPPRPGRPQPRRKP